MKEFCTIREHGKGFCLERRIFLSSDEWMVVKKGFQTEEIAK